GYGGGVAAPLRPLGYPVMEVQFGGAPSDKVHYRFKMDEMWSLGREALKNGMVVPGVETDYGQRILDDLTQREFGYTKAGSKVALESKTDMKARGIASPDFADALFLTYAQEVAINIPGMTTASSQVRHEFDPYADDTPKPRAVDPTLPLRYAQRM
ncbi:hypothetical protein LCGC14_2745800, partial [marine sediment metagenome]